MSSAKQFEQAFLGVVGKWPKAYTAEQVNLIYKKLDHLNFDQMILVSKHILENFRVAPLINEFDGVLHRLGLRKKLASFENTEGLKPKKNHTYWLVEKYWANDETISYFGESVWDCRVVYKNQIPNHPLIKLDNEVREKRLQQIEYALENGSYEKLMSGWIQESKKYETGTVNQSGPQFNIEIKGMKTLNPSDGIGRGES